MNNNVNEISISNVAQCLSYMQNYNVLLFMALINLKSSTGNVIQCRVLIKNASQNSTQFFKLCRTIKFQIIYYYSYINK